MRRLRRVSTMALLLVGTACSGGDKIVSADGSPSTPSTGGNSSRLAANDSLFLVGFMSSGAWGLMKQMRTLASIQQPGFGNTRPACTPQAVVGGIDNDRNGVPDDQTTTYAPTSCAFLLAGLNTTANGSIRLQDLGSLYGYRITYNNYTLTGTRGDSVVTTSFNGTLEFRYANGASGTAADNTVQVIRQQSSQGSLTITRTAALTGTLTPSSGTFAIGAYPGSSMSLTGRLNIQLVLTGNVVQTGYPSTVNFNMAVSNSAALTSPTGCLSNPGFTAGTINGALTGTWTAQLRQNYTTCGSGTADNPGKR